MIFKKMSAKRDNTKLLKVLKIGAGTVFGLFLVVYLSFLFILPNFLDINKFTPQIEAELKKQTKLGFELSNPKLKTTWRLGVKLSADKISLKYSDNRDFIDIKSPSIEINLPTLLFKQLNLDKIYSEDINVLLVFDKNKQYTIMNYFIFPPENGQKQDVAPFPIDIKNINIISKNATLILEDKNINKNFKVEAKNSHINLLSLEGPLKFKTEGKISTADEAKNFVDFDINLFVKFPSQNETAKTIEPIGIQPFNPFENLDRFNFKSKILVDLKINDLENFDAKGYLKISDTTLTLNSIQLPKSFLNADFKGNEVKADTNLYLAENEFLNSKSVIKLGKSPYINLNVKSEKLTLSNIISVGGAVLNILNIPNDFNNISSKGYITGDFDLKSDMKKIKSRGNLKVIDGAIAYKKMNLNLTNITSTLDFSDNKVVIKNSNANLNGAKFMVAGEVLSNSKLNININSDPLKIAEIVKLGESLKVIKQKDIADFAFKGGLLKIAVELKGDMKNPLPLADVVVNGLKVTVKSMNLPLSIAKINLKIVPNKKDFNITILMQNVAGGLINPKLSLNIPQVKITGNSKNLSVPSFNAILEGSNANIEGRIDNYAISPKLDFTASGNVSPNTILAFVPKSSRSMVKYAGKMPFNGVLRGDFTNLAIDGTLNSNPQNYVSAVDIESLRGANNKLGLSLNLEGDELIINDISLNSKTATVKGKISNINAKTPTINGISVVVPQKLNIILPAFDNTRLSLSTNLNISGNAISPLITGNCSISNLKYPPLNLNVQGTNLDFKRGQIGVNATGVKLGSSDFAGDLVMSSNFSKSIVINNLKFNSNYIDADELMKIASLMPNTQTTAGPTANIVIKSGKAGIARLKSGQMSVENIAFDFNMYKNLFKMTNFMANAYEGRITGEIDYNIAQLKGDVNLVGKNINVRKAAKPTTGVALPLSGTLDGIVKVGFRGDTYQQQMRTLKGIAKFTVSDGEMRDFIRFENFLYASNILSQNFLGFNLNSVASAVGRVDTGQFKTLNGTITFTGGWANIQEFKSTGPNMSLWANGRFNLLTNFVDMKVLGRISPRVASVLGPMGNFSLNSAIEKLPEKGQEIFNIIKSVAPKNPLFMEVSPSEIAKIPPLSVVSGGESKEFQVVLNGPAESSRSVKSFKWIGNNPPTN